MVHLVLDNVREEARGVAGKQHTFFIARADAYFFGARHHAPPAAH